MAGVSPTVDARSQNAVDTETGRPHDGATHTATGSNQQDPDKPSKERTTRVVTYCSTGIQTLPPRNAQEFQMLHGREPTDQELVSRIGTAAIGRFGAGSVANAHEVTKSTSFSSPGHLRANASYADALYQTVDVAQCKMSIARSKAKASMLVNKQRAAAEKVGYRVWSETKDEKILHSEQFAVRTQFDKEGNVTSADAGDLLLPNIYGEEINFVLAPPKPKVQTQQDALPQRNISFTKSVDLQVYVSNCGLTPPTTPPPAPLDEAARDRLHLRRIHTFAPSELKEVPNPISLEDYGYIHRVPRPVTDGEAETGEEVLQVKDIEETQSMSEKDEEILEVGGYRFADRYIVYDATQPVSPTISSTGFPPASKKRRSSQSDMESSQGSPKRSKTSDARSISEPPLYEQYVHEETARYLPTKNDATLPLLQQDTTHETEEQFTTGRDEGMQLEEEHRDVKQGGQPTGRGSHRKDRSHSAPRKNRDREETHVHHSSRRRIRSRDDRKHRSDRQSRSRARRDEEDPYEAERHRYENARKRKAAGKDARNAEERQRERGAERVPVLEAQERQRKTEEDRARARMREVEQSRQLELEEKRQAHEAKDRRRQEEKEQERARRRERSTERGKDNENRKPKVSAQKTTGPEDPYAKSREEEACKRKAARELPEGLTTRHPRERSVERSTRPLTESKPKEDRPNENRPKEDRAKEDKTKEEKAKKPSRLRPARKPRIELERYDPRKKFGR